MKSIEADLADKRDAITMSLQLACIDTVAEARSLDTYKDRTGNLRASIGYKIRDLYDSQNDTSNFGSGEGGEKGEQTANEALEGNGATVAAVVVAGMPYALYVENRGYDVITGPMDGFVDKFEENLSKALKGLED